MRKIVITGTYIGAVYAHYQANNALACLDVAQAELNTAQLQYFFRNIPLHIDLLPEFCARIKATCIEQVEEVTFDIFYNTFGVKEGRKKAEAVWNKLSAAEQLKAYLYIPKLKGKKQKTAEALPYPASYLNQQRWND